MIQSIIQSGVSNIAWVMASANFVINFMSRSVIFRIIVIKTVFIALTALAIMNMLQGIYLSYTVPRDVMQDIIAAREYLADRCIEPDHMNELIQQALEKESKRKSLFWWNESISNMEQSQREKMFHEHWVQAHPPFVTLLTVPLVSYFGILGTQIVYTLISFLSIVVTLYVIIKNRVIKDTWLLSVLFFGWSSTVSAVRLQQLSLPLLAMIMLAWHLQRNGRGILSGILLGLSVQIKLIPGVMLLPSLARHTRSLCGAMISYLLTMGIVYSLVTWNDLARYQQTASEVINEYAAYSTNISLLGFVSRIAIENGGNLATAKGIWVGSLGIIGLLWAYWLFHKTQENVKAESVIDLEFAQGLCLIPLLSPVAWDHYQVFLFLPICLIHQNLSTRSSRMERHLLNCLILASAIPNSTYLWVAEMDSIPHFMHLYVIQPLRCFVNLILFIWVSILFRNTLQKPFWQPSEVVT